MVSRALEEISNEQMKQEGLEQLASTSVMPRNHRSGARRFVGSFVASALVYALSVFSAPVASTRAQDAGLDLPVQAPVYSPQQSSAPRPPPSLPPNDNDDPSDDPPPVFYGEEIDMEGDTIFYVLDISCSMSRDFDNYIGLDGQQRNGPKIDRAKTELIRSILGLSPNFKFDVVAYDCGTYLWQPEMQQATDDNKSLAASWVNALNPQGATGTGPAVCLALEARENKSAVLLTDGDPNCGLMDYQITPLPGRGAGGGTDLAAVREAHRRAIREGNAQHATISVFGIDASGDYRAFCQGVAADSGGSYFDVP